MMKIFITKIAVLLFSIALCGPAALPAFCQTDQQKLPVEEIALPQLTPEFHDLINNLNPQLHFSSKQQSRVEKNLKNQIQDPINDLADEYTRKKSAAQTLRYKLDDINYSIYAFNLTIADAVRKALTPQQREKLNKMVYEGRFVPCELAYAAKQPAQPPAAAPTPQPAQPQAETPQPAPAPAYTVEVKEKIITTKSGKKRKIRTIIRKKRKPEAAKPAEPAPDAAAAEQAAPAPKPEEPATNPYP